MFVQEFLNGLPDICVDTTHDIAWLVTLACAVISLGTALKFLEHDSRMFTVMALFACSWILVLGIYEQKEAENKLASLMADIASFLDVYIGGLLILEGQIDEQNRAMRVVWLQRWALWLLLFITVPRAFPFPQKL